MSFKVKMIPVPAGRFQRDEEKKNISVVTKPYSLSKYPITREQFLDIMREDPSDTRFSSGSMNEPVQMVNFYHAIAFCNKLSVKEGFIPVYTVEGVDDWENLAFEDIPLDGDEDDYDDWEAVECDWTANGYRLPTEMEWVWAAMGADKDAREGAFDSDGINRTGYKKDYAGQGYGTGVSIKDSVWYDKNSDDKTHPVGEKQPNELGLYDMSGNVSEWCWDLNTNYDLTGTLTDHVGNDFGSLRVNLGGGWNSNVSYRSVGYRANDNPCHQYNYCGFRVLRPGFKDEPAPGKNVILVNKSKKHDENRKKQQHKTMYTSRNIGDLMLVPAGSFQRDRTATNISVITKPYGLSKYPITRQQFLDVMGEDPSDRDRAICMNDPVQMVNWYHAIAFCNKLSLLEGLTPAYTVEGVNDWADLDYSSIPIERNEDWNAATCNWGSSGYRLPTEMEWMWAAMGADQDARYGAMLGGINRTGWSKAYAGQGYGTSTSINDYAWYSNNSSGKTNPVGGKLPNELGLYDMSGNVWEWCWDWGDDYQTHTLTDYSGAGSGSSRVCRATLFRSTTAFFGSGSSRVCRGGCRNYDASCCTVAYRFDYLPYYQHYLRGFRILRPVL